MATEGKEFLFIFCPQIITEYIRKLAFIQQSQRSVLLEQVKAVIGVEWNSSRVHFQASREALVLPTVGGT